jgi:hypothetical protein
MEFTVGGDDPGSFFPVKVTFIGQGSMAGLRVASVKQVGNGEDAVFSEDSVLTSEEYLVV